MCVRAHTFMGACVCTCSSCCCVCVSQRLGYGSRFSFLHRHPRGQTHVFTLGGKHLSLLSHLAWPPFLFSLVCSVFFYPLLSKIQTGYFHRQSPLELYPVHFGPVNRMTISGVGYGMVWCGVVWHDMAWYGMVLYDMA